jgi:hypothetical protein
MWHWCISRSNNAVVIFASANIKKGQHVESLKALPWTCRSIVRCNPAGYANPGAKGNPLLDPDLMIKVG